MSVSPNNLSINQRFPLTDPNQSNKNPPTLDVHQVLMLYSYPISKYGLIDVPLSSVVAKSLPASHHFKERDLIMYAFISKVFKPQVNTSPHRINSYIDSTNSSCRLRDHFDNLIFPLRYIIVMFLSYNKN